MSWASAVKKSKSMVAMGGGRQFSVFRRPDIPQHTPDWARLVSLDFETFYSADYTLKKMSTSEYVRDKRFKAQMVGIKIGYGKTKIYPAAKIKAALAAINWTTHSLLAHNAQFDAFILSHHYDIHPAFVYDSLAMARGLHSNDIGAGLDEVSIFYGGAGKIADTLESTKGVLVWDKALNDKAGIYCANDVDEMFRVFCLMLPKMPADEIDLIHLVTTMFTSPVLRVDIPRVEKELERELERREKLMYAAVDPAQHDIGGELYGKDVWKVLLKTKAERELEGVERDMQIIKRIIGSNEKFADLLRAEGVEPPVKVSDAWIKLDKEDRESEEGLARKYTYAFAKDDAKFINLPLDVESWGLDLDDPDDVQKMAVKQTRLQALVDVRIAVKSTTNITRAERFLEAGRDGMPLPVGYAYYRAHTGRLGGNNKMNMQNLQRGGELRLSILAPKGHVIAVQDSGQIECVAHDSLVLTRDRGYTAIQNIQLTDLLWDGVEWVSHDGVVCTGYKEVITYDGLTATPNHKVWLQDGSSCTLEEVSESETRQGLGIGGLQGQAVRFMDSAERAALAHRTVSSNVPMRGMFEDVPSSVGGHAERQVNPVQKLRREIVEKLARTRAKVRRYMGEVQQSLARQLDDVRSTWNQMPICFQGGIYPMDGGQSSTSQLQGCGDRSDRQRRALRAGEPTACFAESEREQPKDDVLGPMRRRASSANRVYGAASRMWIRARHYWNASPQRDDRRTDRGEVQKSIQKAFVYDILNAGPRHRFTVSDRIVSNCRVNGWLWGQDDLMADFRAADNKTGKDAYCNFASLIYGRDITKADENERFVGKVAVLGLGYQLGAVKLQVVLAKGALGGPPVYFPLTQCQFIVNTYRAKNSAIRMGWEICKGIIEDMAAGREGSHGPINWEADMIWLPNGMCLKYPDLKKSTDENGWDSWTYQSGDMRKKIYGGLLCENIVQALARIIVMWQMLQINKRYRCVMTTHDEVVALAKTAQAQRCVDFMEKWMRTAPAWCHDIPLNSEGGFDVRYSK